MMLTEEEKKTQEVVEAEDKETAEYEAAWDEGEKAEDDGLPVKEDPAPEDDSDPDPDPEAKSDPEPDIDPEKETVQEPVSKEYGSVESMEKAVKDSRSHAMKLQSKNNELQAALEKAEHGKASEEEVKQARLDAAEAEKTYKENREALYEDYPELKGVIEPLVTNNEALKRSNAELTEKVDGYVEENDRASLEKAFNDNVKPHVVKAHPDFDKIISKAEYPVFRAWADAQGEEMVKAAFFSDNPDDIIGAVTAYKKFKVFGATENLKSEQDRRKQAILDNAQTIRGGSPPPTSGSNNDENDYDAGWKEAEKLDKGA